jgi:hypothetical protein
MHCVRCGTELKETERSKFDAHQIWKAVCTNKLCEIEQVHGFSQIDGSLDTVAFQVDLKTYIPPALRK